MSPGSELVQRSGEGGPRPRVCIRTPAEAEVDGQASKEAEVRCQQMFDHQNLSVKWFFPNQKWHHSSAKHVHLALISADGANSYHKMLQCSVYCFSLWCHCQLIPINKNFLIWFGDFLSEGVFIQSPQEAKAEAELSFLQSKLASPPKPERRAKLPGNLFPIRWQTKPSFWFLFTCRFNIYKRFQNEK